MTASTHPLPAPPSRAEATEAQGLSLDERIRAVEERLVEREHRLRRSAHALSQGVQRAVQPWRAALPVAGAAAAALLWWFWRGRRPQTLRTGAPASTVDAIGAGDTGTNGVPWVRMVALVWPFVPAAWRSKVSPALASTLVGLGLPVVESLLRRREVPPLATMPWVDLAQYAGSWHVLARLRVPRSAAAERCSAHYALREDGSLSVDNRCVAGGGSLRTVRGVARAVAGSGGARLRVSLWPQWLRWLPMAWSDYWILHVDDGYSEALVGSPARDFLWLLAREPGLTPERLQRLVQIARDRGFAVEQLHFDSSV